MKLTSEAFENESRIPVRHTCDGENISPSLIFSDVPGDTRAFALIAEDPDVPASVREDGMWNHWVVFDIPPDVRYVPIGEEPPGIQGKGTNGEKGYFGPCPPDREHRYYFKLYALDTTLGLPEGSEKKAVLKAMDGHVIEEAALMGLYERQ